MAISNIPPVKWGSAERSTNTTTRDFFLSGTIANIATHGQQALAKKTGFIDGEAREFFIISTPTRDTYKIVAFPGESLRLGGIVDYSDYKWIIVEVTADEEVYQSGVMRQCNYILKWRNEKREIIERPVITEDGTKYLTGEEQKQTMSYGASRMLLIVSKDDEVVKLNRGKRFLIDDPDVAEPLAFEITKPNRTTLSKAGGAEGVYKHMLSETARSDFDNVELMIADYWEDGDPDWPGKQPSDNTTLGPPKPNVREGWV